MNSQLDSSEETRLLQYLRPLDPDLIYLFGSAAAGRLTPESDVDAAYLSRAILSPEAAFDLSQKIAGELGREVDLIDLAAASDVLRMQVVKTGKPLFVRSPRHLAEFEMYVLSDYARVNEQRRPVLDRIQEEGTIYG